MAESIGLPIGGWKVGAATDGMMAQRALHEPIPGPVFSGRAYWSPAVLPETDFATASLETEFAFRLRESLAPRKSPYGGDDLAASVEAHLAFDLTQSRFSEPPDTLSEIADVGNSGGAVIGPEIQAWRSLDLCATRVCLRVNGGQQVTEYTGRWRRDPLDVLAWLVTSLANRGISLSKGQFVLTGSVTEPQPVGPGSCATASMPGSGTLQACIGGQP